jgi:phosphoglycerol transferase MdoB-like AlkP superfamily enzyme
MVSMSTSVANILRPFLVFSLAIILTLTLSRVGLALWQMDRFHELESILTLIFNGLRIDITSAAYLCALPAFLHPWLIATRFEKIWLVGLRLWFFAMAIAVIFFELTTPAFINEYGFRPNRLFIEYLSYPGEVAKMLIKGLGKVLVESSTQTSFSLKNSLVAFVALLFTLLLSARGTLDHRPINPALVYFSTDPLINSLTLNSMYSVAYAFKQFGDEKNASKLYGKMDEDRIIALVRQETKLNSDRFTSSELPSLAKRLPTYQGKPKNLVIILQESLGAQFVSSLGGIPITPEIDKLTKEGWAFKRLYATGTRSVRGIEAVITGFTPTPSRAVVKLDKSQRDFFTIASLLKDNGYHTQFVYGGESHFDNMKSFFLGNGFTDIVDFDDIENPHFVASWGASDDDLYNQTDIELTKLHTENKPFFSLIFTSSNHDPFEIPQGIVTPIEYTDAQLQKYDSNELRRHKAIQYADYSLGKFIANAKKRAYWEDTVFLIVADHDARANGRDLVPINNFHIPGVILNSGSKPILDERVVSQIDLAPTLLSIIGVTNYSPMLGQDLTNPTASGRAMMQYAENFAYMIDNEVTILQPEKAPLNFIYDDSRNELIRKDDNAKLSEIALAHVLWGSLAYKNQWFASQYQKQ